MLISFHQKILGTIAQWLDFTGSIIYPKCQPVRIRIKNPDAYRQNDAQRYLRASKYQ